MSAKEEDSLLESPEERRWARGESLQGVDPNLMGARRSDFPDGAQGSPEEDPAALSPLLIPLAAILNGPLVAALLTLFTDGRPPRASHLIAALSIGAVGWLLLYGAAASTGIWLPPHYLPPVRLLVLLAVGLLLWFLYLRWMKGRRGQDHRTLVQSAVVFLVLSAIFWVARDTPWWSWLGR